MIESASFQLARNIGSKLRKSTCNGPLQRSKLNGFLHFFSILGDREPSVTDALPIVLVPGLNCSARLYAEQIPALWRFGPVTVADHTRDDTLAAIARRILAAAPPRFALAGLSMGGYISFEIMRQAPERVAKLALLDTGARAETPEQTKARLPRIELAKRGRVAEVADVQFPVLVHREPPRRRGAQTPRSHHGRGDRGGGVPAPADRDDGPAGFASRPRRDRLPDAGPRRRRRCVDAAGAGARDRRRYSADRVSSLFPTCGHLSTIERPEAVTKAMVEWMEL